MLGSGTVRNQLGLASWTRHWMWKLHRAVLPQNKSNLATLVMEQAHQHVRSQAITQEEEEEVYILARQQGQLTYV